MIDLSGLLTHDVEIRVQGDGILVYTQKQDVTDDVLNLPAPIWSQQMRTGVLDISPRTVDTIALAERLALTWETRGYIVKRVVTPLGYTKPSNVVQSFILA